ncbi:hypothetical protein BC936DRAFT_149516 [Jimgerdemannia flammicorona]|uniref:Beta-flanking protein n=1 Tax=Jimgerdemannia flammicorona TaxID=994334 RepID=A0A433D0P2_9FUNG|nr:hypothetical protein BC936DRAFT_149516 [Jimgerdemannia flammicorona]
MSEERKKGGRRHRAPKPSDEAYERASKHSGGEDPSFFRGAVQNVLGRRKTEGNDDSDSDGSPPPHHRPVNEEDVESLSRAHEEIYKKSDQVDFWRETEGASGLGITTGVCGSLICLSDRRLTCFWLHTQTSNPPHLLPSSLISSLSQEGRPKSHHTDEDVGKAAAVQAFRKHQEEQKRKKEERQEEAEGSESESESESEGEERGGGGGDPQALMGMAMGEAMNLFNAGGGSGDKSAMVQSAAMMAMKIYMAQQSSKGGDGGGGMGGMIGGLMGGGGGGGGGGAMGLISKLL